jgi:hypothetical protein
MLSKLGQTQTNITSLLSYLESGKTPKIVGIGLLRKKKGTGRTREKG